MAAALCVAIAVMSPAVSGAQSNIPVAQTSAPVAVSRQLFGTILNVRALHNGQVLLNDGLSRQLIILDSALAVKTVLLDSTTTNGQSYGPRASPLIAYLGDSTLFVDGPSSSLLLIDPTGKIVRTMAAPQPRDARFLAGSASGTDANGNLLYRVALIMQQQRAAKAGEPTVILAPDSAAIVRANFSTRAIDTIGRVRINNGSRTETIRDEAGAAVSSKFVINPINVIDEWAVLSNGTVAIVRGQDYHVDWISADGKKQSTKKMPFDWKSLTESDKQRAVDSARTAQEKQLNESMAAASQGTLGGTLGAPRSTPVRPQITFVPLNVMSDYEPPLAAGAVKSDLDGNLWILPRTSVASSAGGLVYDVVNERGELHRRVRLPAGRVIAGFGGNGVLFLTQREATGWKLERVVVGK